MTPQDEKMIFFFFADFFGFFFDVAHQPIEKNLFVFKRNSYLQTFREMMRGTKKTSIFG